jgi:hypothetical protein
VTGITTARGYGAQHQALRKQQLERWRPGDPCARCGLPMWSRWTFTRNGDQVSAIDLGHTADRTGWTGLEHRACNRGEAAARGNRMRAMAKRWRPPRWRPPRQW